MTQARSSSNVTDSGSMIGNFFKKAQFWRSSHNHTMPKEWFEQTLPLRYLADDPMERDLDRIFGKEGWEPVKVCLTSQNRLTLRFLRPGSAIDFESHTNLRRWFKNNALFVSPGRSPNPKTELKEIVDNGRNHYEQSGEALDAMS